jgi:glycosyltransferase involved in cell wall biosynthesis/4-amino-4-deoxy-L-arabinose transferase-like glycosyltransferase
MSLRIIMLSYERGFLDPASEASARLNKLAMSDAKITAIVLSNAGASKGYEHGTIRVVGLAGSPVVRFFSALKTAYREVKRARMAGETPVISAQDPFLAGKIAFIVSRLLNVPYELQEHADYFSGKWEHELPVIHEVMTWGGIKFLRRADHVRVVSERIREQMIRVGVQQDRVSVIPVAQQLPAPVTRSWSDAQRIVVPCRFVKQKGLDVLMKSLAMLKKDGVAFRVRLIGEGKEGPKIAELASKLGIRDRIEFEQWSPSDQLWKDADLFVLSSNYEGWGRTIVEAMAAGVPIVTTDVGCVGSFFRPQIDGRVVQPGDAKNLAAAIKEQLTEKERAEWMVKNARERAKEFPSADQLMNLQREAWRSMSSRPAPTTENRRAWMGTAAIIGFATLVHAVAVGLFWHSLGPNREWGFFTLIEHFFQGFGYSFASQAGCVSAYRSPGFLFFLTAVYGLFGYANFFAQAVIQNALAVLLAYLVYRLAWRITSDRRVGWIAALLITLHPYTFYHYTQYYHTVLSGTFLVSVLLCLFALDRTKKMKWAVAAGVMVAALAYIQGTILPVMPFLSLWLLWRWRKEWKKAVVAIGIIAVTSAALIAPWTYRNWKAFHEFIPLTTDLGHALAKANSENILGLTILGFPQEVQTSDRIINPENPREVKYVLRPEAEQALAERGWLKPSGFFTEWHPREPGENWPTCEDIPTTEPAFSKYWTTYGMGWLKQNYWTDGLKLQLLKVAQFWAPLLQPSLKYGAQWSFASNPILEQGARWSLALFVFLTEFAAIAAIIEWIRRRKIILLIPLLIPMVVFSFMHSFFAGYTKYRIPLDNLLVILAAITIVGVWDHVRRKKKV